tara:strand:+ start:65 stop:376 length:312 start_codon:yes stop_codon:yes gene_type:complete
MKILDDITNKIIQNDDCVEMSFHAHSIKKNAPTLHKTFENRRFYISVETAENLIDSISNIDPNQSVVHLKLKKSPGDELDQITIQFSPDDVRTFPINEKGAEV